MNPREIWSPLIPRGRRGPVFLGVALVSLCVLMLQLTLTRLFSATMYYHYAFMAISLALFGSGAAGVCVYLLQQRLRPERLARWLSVAACLFGVSTVVALLVVLANPLSPVFSSRTTLERLVRIYGAIALPFFFAGCAVTLAVVGFAREMSRLYLYDLLGAATGCLLLIPVLDRLGAVDTVLLVAALAGVAAWLFESAADGNRAYRAGLLAVTVGLAGLLAYNHVTGSIDVRSAKGLNEVGHVIFSRWNSFSRVTVWGSLESDGVLIMIDADAATAITRNGRDLARHAWMARSLETLVYTLKTEAKTLIVGPGGGNDVIMARLFGAPRVTAVEVNPIIAGDVMMSEPFKSYSGNLYEQAGVRLVVDEGRSFIRRTQERYDVIQGTKVDTWAATAAGAFSLTENNLYTVEAFHDYLAHLEDDGILSMTRWYTERPDQLLRLCSLALATMRERGIEDPARHIIVVRGAMEPGFARAPGTFLFKKSPFSDAEAQVVESFAEANGFEPLFTPLRRPDNDFTRLITAERPAEVWDSYESDISPTRDNNPFFFHTVRLRGLGKVLESEGESRKSNLGTVVLFGLLGITSLLTIAFILGPLAVARGEALAGRTAAKLAWLLYFACLGSGFIIVEVALIQKCILFLGHPVYALAVVLFSLLTFSALGSGLSGRVSDERLRPALARVLLVVVGLTIVAIAGLSPVFQSLMYLERGYRIAVTVALLAPLGLVMGMPMPGGIRLLAAEAHEIVPWAWGVNGAASVMGSVVALGVAILTGFNQALLLAAALYLLALACLRWASSARP